MIGLEPLIVGVSVMTDLARYVRSLERFAERLGVHVERCALPSRIHGRTRVDHIALAPQLTEEDELAALIHELAHWLVHRPRLSPVRSAVEVTLYEYEAEAVEALVLGRLGVTDPKCALPVPLGSFEEDPTAGLLAASVGRVRIAATRLTGVLECSGFDSESQPAVDLDAAAGEEVILENEAHRMGDFFRLAEPL